MILKDGMLLYHGSYAEINRIDLSMCDEKKDFGQGFYLTEDRRQAESFIKTSLIKAKNSGKIPMGQMYGFVTEYRVHLNPRIECHGFEGTNEDWLYYISINRRKQLSESLTKHLSEDFNKYDVLIGRIANDDTNATINAYLSGTYGEIGSDQSFEIVRQFLKPERLKNQFCFKRDDALAMLEKVGSTRYDVG